MPHLIFDQSIAFEPLVPHLIFDQSIRRLFCGWASELLLTILCVAAGSSANHLHDQAEAACSAAALVRLVPLGTGTDSGAKQTALEALDSNLNPVGSRT